MPAHTPNSCASAEVSKNNWYFFLKEAIYKSSFIIIAISQNKKLGYILSTLESERNRIATANFRGPSRGVLQKIATPKGRRVGGCQEQALGCHAPTAGLLNNYLVNSIFRRLNLWI